MFPELNIPIEPVSIKQDGENQLIYDPVRKKQLKLTPEEWVRQHIIRFLVEKLGYPASLTRTESGVTNTQKAWRTDILVYDREGKPLLLVECKSFSVEINKEVLYQASRYNQKIKAKCIVLTNGMTHFCMVQKSSEDKFIQLFHIPEFEELCGY